MGAHGAESSRRAEGRPGRADRSGSGTTAVLRLAQEGRLNLGTPVTSLLDLEPMAGRQADARLANVTMWRLLQHSGGWDREISDDPGVIEHKIADTLGTGLPNDKADMMTYMTGLPLDFAPGSRFAYCNYGYLLLGRVIEAITGQSYGSYVTGRLLAPLGITRMRLGRTLKADTPGEVPYESRYTATTVLDESGAKVPRPYGGFNMDNKDASGGWVATAMDLVRFERVFDVPSAANVLDSRSISRAFARPEWGTFSSGSWYGAGWYVREKNGGYNTWHTGGLAGTYTYLVRRYDGVTYAACFNRRDEGAGPAFDVIGDLLYDVADNIATWPSVDYGSLYF
ncbi:class A beta-lactamase-related serine hydrolase [Nonomuraea deserti]|uniref:Class A beta-lactamase-related serine hydrolase n=1 Tax=Nonomuraea deserti TaxID=1848322 RepID=A0A4R4VY96_9ACTN|nr:serine hydrolase domain-containing protein [Nonomuraea deserti]TDD10431.1 class A beta-lactamase-related serine hydrolase [Nonomuraea deserti]